MEFWGVEVKAGESLKVKPELFKLIHISQAAIGEVKDVKEAKYVPLRLTVGENSYVIGTLSAEDRPQLMVDLVFEKEFELSHGWENGSVYFMGYTADDPSTDEIDSGDDDFEDEENPLDALNGKLEEKKAAVKDVKPALVKDASTEKNAKVAEPKKEAESDDDDDDSEDDSDDEDDSDEDDSDVPVGMDSDGPQGMDFSDDSEDDDSEEDEDEDSEEETPKKFEQKKRPAPSPKVAPGSGKKAKQATPDKTGGKKGPAPTFAKQNGKPAANGNNKSKAQSPKSGGQFSGKSNKNFSGQQKNFKGKHGKK